MKHKETKYPRLIPEVNRSIFYEGYVKTIFCETKISENISERISETIQILTIALSLVVHCERKRVEKNLIEDGEKKL